MALPAGIVAAACAASAPSQSEAAQAGSQVKAQASTLAVLGEQGIRAGKEPSRERDGQAGKPPAQARRSERSLAPVGRRDPFRAPPAPVVTSEEQLKAEAPQLPGTRGLVISQLRLEGIVREEESRAMIAVVTNTTNLAYFLKEHEPVYDGVVARIAPDAVYFRENIRDPDRGVTSREVVLRMGPAPGVAK